MIQPDFSVKLKFIEIQNPNRLQQTDSHFRNRYSKIRILLPKSQFKNLTSYLLLYSWWNHQMSCYRNPQ